MAIDIGVVRDDKRDAETPLGLTVERFSELLDKINQRLPIKFTPATLAYVVVEECDTAAEAILMSITFCRQ